MRREDNGFFIYFAVILAGITYIFGIIMAMIFAIVDVFKSNIALIFIFGGVGIYAIYQVFVFLYFKSDGFKKIKKSIKAHIKNCNDLNHYIQELKCSYVNIQSVDFGEAQMVDLSNYNFKRREWNNNLKSQQIHHCSATVCKNACNQPIKYFCKYFGIKKNEDELSNFERVLNDFASVEEGMLLLRKERNAILSSIFDDIPSLLWRFSKNRLINKLGFEVIDLSHTYIPVFSFQYVSPGGNSSSRCDIELNIANLNKLINYLSNEIKWRKSVAGQRALMTSKLREKIKTRDNYACCNCSLSIKDEPNLLLEIDHIIPISKGGLTSEDNLQTLCWKCNRTKGAKIMV